MSQNASWREDVRCPPSSSVKKESLASKTHGCGTVIHCIDEDMEIGQAEHERENEHEKEHERCPHLCRDEDSKSGDEVEEHNELA